MSTHLAENLRRAQDKKLALHGNVNGRFAVDYDGGSYTVKLGGRPVASIHEGAFETAISPYNGYQEDGKPDALVKKALRRTFRDAFAPVGHIPLENVSVEQRGFLIEQAFGRLGIEAPA